MSLKAYLSVSCLLYTYIVRAEYNCTSVSSGTCTIDRTTTLNSDSRPDIMCSAASNCNVQCSVPNACSTTIYCPPNGALCVINCATAHACSDATIISRDCANVTLNIDGNTQNMQITAPADIGSLFITTSADSYFEQNQIYSSSATNNMIINCNGDCSDNTIHAANITGALNISCIYGDCDTNTIYCPNQCNIRCNNCADTSIISNIGGIADVNWLCHRDCTNSSLSDRDETSQLWWKECAPLWLLLDTETAECPRTTEGDDDFNQQQFTILAFVLIGTVVGCLCVIVVTTIICCICWHEHQIRSLNTAQNNPTDDTKKYDLNVQKSAENLNVPHSNHSNLNVITVKERTPSIAESSEQLSPMPVPNSVSTPENMHNIIYHKSPKRHSHGSHRSNNRNLNVVKPQPQPRQQQQQQQHQPQHYTQPPQQQNPSSSSSGKPIKQHRDVYKKHSHPSSRNASHSSRKSSPDKHPFEQRHVPQRDKKHRGSRKTSANSSTSQHHSVSNQSKKRRSYSSNTRRIKQQIQVEQQIANQQQQHYNNINKQRQAAKTQVSYNEEEEAADDLFPLQNDRIGQHYTNGQYDIYANRKKNKDQIKMQLAAYPSNISAGTTGTAEMNFVGSNYNEYNPMVNNNSYFKEDAASLEPTLSLGDLDSGETATTVTTVTTVASSVAMTGTTPTSPDFNAFKKQQQGHTKFQGRQPQKHKRREPNDIKIMQPHQGKVKHNPHQRKNPNQEDSSPTLTYSSPNAEY